MTLCEPIVDKQKTDTHRNEDKKSGENKILNDTEKPFCSPLDHNQMISFFACRQEPRIYIYEAGEYDIWHGE